MRQAVNPKPPRALQDLIQTYVGTPANLDRIRNRLISSNLEMDYQAMLYGASVRASQRQSAFALRVEGARFRVQSPGSRTHASPRMWGASTSRPSVTSAKCNLSQV